MSHRFCGNVLAAIGGTTAIVANALATAPIERRTTASHPMRYVVSLPSGWSATQKWPVVVVITDAGREFDKVARTFADARGPRPFIVVVPLVLSGGGNAQAHKEDFDYSPSAWAWADSAGNCAFDENGMTAMMRDLREKFSADDRVYITGLEAGGHVIMAQLFEHPDRYRGAVAVTPNYQARCVTSMKRAPASVAGIPVRGFHGSKDALWATSPLPAQWTRADSAARARGFTNVADTLIAGQDHDFMAVPVLQFFDSLRPR